MKRFKINAVLVALLSTASITLFAQSPPPVQGTVALEGTMTAFYRGLNKIIVTTMDGVEHAYHFTTNLVVHGGRGTGVDALEGLREGSTVVVHYSGEGADQSALEVDRIGDNGLKVTEGVVTRIDGRRKRITIRFDSGRAETFQLTNLASAEAAKDVDLRESAGTKVTIYYSDKTGHKVAHLVRKTS